MWGSGTERLLGYIPLKLLCSHVLWSEWVCGRTKFGWGNFKNNEAESLLNSFFFGPLKTAIDLKRNMGLLKIALSALCTHTIFFQGNCYKKRHTKFMLAIKWNSSVFWSLSPVIQKMNYWNLCVSVFGSSDSTIQCVGGDLLSGMHWTFSSTSSWKSRIYPLETNVVAPASASFCLELRILPSTAFSAWELFGVTPPGLDRVQLL